MADPTHDELPVSISAQISVYPLRQRHLGPFIEQALESFEEHGLEIRRGAMSSLVRAEDEAFFTALRDAYRQVSRDGDVVMVVTLSNACPSDDGT